MGATWRSTTHAPQNACADAGNAGPRTAQSQPALQGRANHGQADAHAVAIPANACQRPQAGRHQDCEGTDEEVQQTKQPRSQREDDEKRTR